MQRDFVEPGGFGEALGNDVTPLQAVIAPCKRMLDAARRIGMLVIHTREGHSPDLADCPPTKIVRGRGATRIGDPGPMGRILVRGERGHDIVAELYPVAGEVVIDKPGKGAFYATDLDLILHNRGIKSLIVCGVTTEVCVNTTVREANDRGYECVVLADCVGSYFPEFQRVGAGDDQGAGRHLRLGVGFEAGADGARRRMSARATIAQARRAVAGIPRPLPDLRRAHAAGARVGRCVSRSSAARRPSAARRRAASSGS